MSDGLFKFSVDVAKQYGMSEDILIVGLHRLMDIHRESSKIIGHQRWTRLACHEITDELPFLSFYRVKKSIKSLVKAEALFQRNLNEDCRDTTWWYAFQGMK